MVVLAVVVAEPLQSRSDPEFEFPGAQPVSRQVQRAVERGLDYLAARQHSSGGWTGEVGAKRRESYWVFDQEVPHVGVTALACMAFLAGGHLPGQGPYGECLKRATEHLLHAVNDFGFISEYRTRMYSHAFATLYLAEVHGMAALSQLEEKLQTAVDMIVGSQNDDGSWRYQPFTWQSDLSVTVCQLMALRASRNIGLHVPLSTIEQAVDYVEQCQIRYPHEAHFLRPPMGYYCSAPGAFRYQVYGDQRSSFALTAAGVTSLYHAARYDQEMLRQSLEFLDHSQQLMSDNGYVGHYFYYYGHYYAAQAFFIAGSDPAIGKDYWQRYWRRTSAELLGNQEEDGSWPNPIGPGSAFGTAVACVVLQIPYQYLPVLQR
jgi:hypothetical protein